MGTESPSLYGVGFYDLSKEPVVITVGDIKDRYWSIQLCDDYARWWHLIGSQFNAPGSVRRLLIGPNWSGKYPPEFVGAEVVQAASDMMCVVGRVALTVDTADELKAVNVVQDRSIAIRSTAICSSAANYTPRTASSSSTSRTKSPRMPTSARTGYRRRRMASNSHFASTVPTGP